MLSAIVTFVDALPLVNYQFQCISHSVYQLCMFPEQYCHSSGFLSECRPCSKDVCDKLHDDDFPLQCRYNCTVGKYLLLCIHFVNASVPYYKGEVNHEYEYLIYICLFSIYKSKKVHLSVQR